MISLKKIFLLVSGVLWHFAMYAQESDFLHWHKDRKLTFEDFRLFISEDSSVGGLCDCQVKVLPKISGDTITYSVSARFDPETSGLSERDSTLLAHEQRHFDICEITARTVRKYLTSKHPIYQGSQSEIDTHLKTLLDQNEALQETYDNESRHGTDVESQQKWNKKIEEMLNELCSYENSNRDG